MNIAKEVVLMRSLTLTSLLLAIFIHPLYAESSLYTNRSGYTTGTQDGRSVNTYTDRYGNTTGWVGGKYQNTYSDGYGGTTGTIGNKRINTYDDGYGNITGTIGRDRIDLHTDPSGTTTGTVGQRRLKTTGWLICFTSSALGLIAFFPIASQAFDFRNACLGHPTGLARQ